MTLIPPWLQPSLQALQAARSHALLLHGASGLGQWPLGQALAAANRNEVAFYARAASRALPVPRCLFAAADPDSGASLVLLEDLPRHRAVRLVTGCSASEATQVVTALAGVHAAFTDDKTAGAGLPRINVDGVGIQRIVVQRQRRDADRMRSELVAAEHAVAGRQVETRADAQRVSFGLLETPLRRSARCPVR